MYKEIEEWAGMASIQDVNVSGVTPPANCGAVGYDV
jgi:hypothetical protein